MEHRDDIPSGEGFYQWPPIEYTIEEDYSHIWQFVNILEFIQFPSKNIVKKVRKIISDLHYNNFPVLTVNINSNKRIEIKTKDRNGYLYFQIESEKEVQLVKHYNDNTFKLESFNLDNFDLMNKDYKNFL